MIKSKGERRKAKVSSACLTACSLVGVILAFPAAAQQAQQQEELGRLFFTPAQRSSLDIARSQRARTTLATERTEEQQVVPQEQTITYGGMIRRSDGQSTVWINGKPVTEREAVAGTTVVGRVSADGSVSLQNPQSGRTVSLKPGQSLELLSGTIEEGYTRKPVAPEPKPQAKPAADGKKGGKPGAEEVARAERDRQDQEKERLEEALRALQAAGTLRPAPAPAKPAPQPLQQRP
jgi:hypothetical protein